MRIFDINPFYSIEKVYGIKDKINIDGLNSEFNDY